MYYFCNQELLYDKWTPNVNTKQEIFFKMNKERTGITNFKGIMTYAPTHNPPFSHLGLLLNIDSPESIQVVRLHHLQHTNFTLRKNMYHMVNCQFLLHSHDKMLHK